MPVNQINNPSAVLLKYWLPVLACMGVIFYFSSFPGKDIPAIFPMQETLYHTAMYAITAYSFARALKNSSSRLSHLKVILFTFVFGVLYGLSDEFHQTFIPGRSSSGLDLFIDGIGSLLGGLLYR